MIEKILLGMKNKKSESDPILNIAAHKDCVNNSTRIKIGNKVTLLN